MLVWYMLIQSHHSSPISTRYVFSSHKHRVLHKHGCVQYNCSALLVHSLILHSDFFCADQCLQLWVPAKYNLLVNLLWAICADPCRLTRHRNPYRQARHPGCYSQCPANTPRLGFTNVYKLDLSRSIQIFFTSLPIISHNLKNLFLTHNTVMKQK